jgi:ParB family transcriptional regulator, chromosome partitioning protein
MSSAKRNALGKGLTALLADKETDVTSRSALPVNIITEIAVNDIEANPFQPREEFDETALNELEQSIKVHGIIQPLTVRKIGYGKYQLISGERRLRASIRAGVQKVPAYIRVADDQEMLELALIENIQRQNLNSIEVAISYKRLLEECNLKQEELATRVGKERSTVTNYLRLLKLPAEVQAAIRDARITMGHARALINIPTEEQQIKVLNTVLENELSVRATEQLASEGKKAPVNKKGEKTEEEKDDFQLWRFEIWERRFSGIYNRKVKIKAKKGEKGEVIIPFASEEDLEKISQILGLKE